jgi:hypothetical protein
VELLLSMYVIRVVSNEGCCALPGAPVISKGNSGQTLSTVKRFRGYLAGGLHRAAWVVESKPQIVLRACE